ncbi:MAG: LacI family transcriptional regulator [Lachnospiraceae bacterium]|nr:LacI family transcriptional regulator [Lachnospiraceae bacterium]
MRHDVTIIDIARKAGVSTATVSRVLNGTGQVQEKTRLKVERAVREMNYRPNPMAKNLSSEHSNVIGMLVSDIRNPFYANIFVECEKYANEKGYSLILCDYGYSDKIELQYYSLLLAQRVCAIIHIGGTIDRRYPNADFMSRLAEVSEKIPVVTSSKMDIPNCRCVKLDNYRITKAAMEYLLSLGHERIAMVGGRDGVLSTCERRQCYQEIRKKEKLKYNCIAKSDTYDIQGGYLAGREALQKDILPTAMIAINDFLAIGMVQAIQERGLKIGKDISVVSFDNTYIAEMLEPELTSVGNDYYAFSRAVIDVAISMKKGRNVQDVRELPICMDIRSSCGKAVGKQREKTF